MGNEKHDLEELISKDLESKADSGEDSEDIQMEVIDPDTGSVINATFAPVGDESDQEVSEFEKQIQDLKREKEEMYDRLLRKQADFENYRKRIDKQQREFQQYALSEFLFELIPILDNFERALSHPEEESGSDYRRGVELIYRQLRDLLEKKGLRPVETEGKLFDPNFHEAISREFRNDIPENSILEVFQKGYFFRDRLLRPALVKVSSHGEETPDESDGSVDNE